MAGYGNGLNFQTHQQVDPSASLQTALGAGGMFAQTLKSMQAYDENQQKMAMMQSDRDRQAKIDFDAAQEKAKNLGALEAANTPTVTTDYGNYAYQSLQNAGKDKMIEERKDAALNGYKPLAYKDIYAGVDTSKMDKDQLAIMQTQLASDSQKSDYTAANKLDVLHKLNMQNGMNSEDAFKAASSRLGLSATDAAGLSAADKEQLAFGSKVEAAANNPLVQQTRGQALKEYKAKYGTTEGIEKAISQTQEAESMAAKEMQDKVAQMNAQKATMQDGEAKDNLSRQIDILKLQAESLNSPYARASLKAEASTGSGSKQSYRSDADKVLASYLNTYKSAPADVRNNITELANDMKSKQYSPEQISAALAGSVSKVDGIGKEPDKYVFSRSTLANQSPDTEAFQARYGAKGSAESNASVYAQADKERNALLNQQAALIAQGGAKNQTAIAELDKRIAELGRSKIESARDYGTLLGQEFMREENLGGYKTALEGTENRTKAKQDNIATALTSGSGVQGVTNAQSTDQPVQSGNVYDKTMQILKVKENSNPYGYHMDTYEKTGTDRPAIGLGFSIKDINSRIQKENVSLPDGKKIQLLDESKASTGGSATDAGQKRVIDEVTKEFIQKNNAIAAKTWSSADTKNPAYNDLIAATTSAYHQYGGGSKVIGKVVSEAQKLMDKADYQGAINAVHKSPYGVAHPERAEDMMAAIAQYAKAENGQQLSVPTGFKFASKAAADKYYAQTEKYLKSQKANDTDVYKTLYGLKQSMNNQFGEQNSGSNIQNTAMSPNDLMLRTLNTNNSVAPTADSLIQPNYVQQSGIPVATIRANAENAVNDYGRYKQIHDVQSSTRNTQLEQDGKSPMQVAAIKQAGMESSFANAKTPKDRLAVIAAAQQKLNEQASLQQSLLGF